MPSTNFLRTGFDTSGLFPITGPSPADSGPDGWLLSFQPNSAFGGSIVLYQDQNTFGSITTQSVANMTAVPWTDLLGNIGAATTPLSWAVGGNTTITVIVGQPTLYRVWANITAYAGILSVVVTPYTAPDTRGQTALWSGLTLDAVPPIWDDTFEIVAAVQDAGNLND